MNHTFAWSDFISKKIGENPIQGSKPRLLSKMDCVLSGFELAGRLRTRLFSLIDQSLKILMFSQ